jgi:hypothetical protein
MTEWRMQFDAASFRVAQNAVVADVGHKVRQQRGKTLQLRLGRQGMRVIV